MNMDKLEKTASLLRGIAKLQRTADAAADVIGMAAAVEQALEALTPRVLDADEVTALPDVVWLEDVDKTEVVPGLPFRHVTWCGANTVEIHVRDGFVAPLLCHYGIRWRAWNRRPDEADREKYPWVRAPEGVCDELDD